jgi:mannose/cellobiose epimerase-like protein (N-acyl-D-glucosamine 2-epimerase family)
LTDLLIDWDAEGRRLLAFARHSRVDGIGFGWLDDTGAIDRSQGVHTWITARMTYVFALAALQGEPGALDLAEHGVTSLASGPLRDREHGGWLGSVSDAGSPRAVAKLAYDHAFVVLAASTAVAAGAPGAEALLDDAVAVFDEHFLDGQGRVVDSWSRDFSAAEAYRGANSSMHSVEALLALGDVRADPTPHPAALAIAEHLVHRVAVGGHGGRLPEHFDAGWTEVPDYNVDQPDDPFRPFGVTPGHLFEWSRLLLQLESVLPDPPDWLLADAELLFRVGVEIGWSVDGQPGIVYTTDWQDRPVVRNRMHWVHAEAVAIAATLAARTGRDEYAAWETSWWEFIESSFIEDRGEAEANWRHELDEDNRPVSRTWSGRPDVYHAYQALLLSRYPSGASLAKRVRPPAGPSS